jgi:uncharacterized protein involved in type VI secretion and phage assembly
MRGERGVVTGVVHKVDAKQGRVMVEYRNIEDRMLSPWAYIAAPLSGKGRGALFMPEEGDEVLVCYGDGEFARPYVVGFLWNGEHISPESEASNRVIVTPGGHQLRFEDKDGDKRVVLKTKGEHRLALDDKDKSVTLESTGHHKLEIQDNGGKVVLTTQNGGKVTLEDSGKATVEASQNIITLGPDGITIEVKSGTLNVKSSAVMNVESSAAMNVKSSAAMNVQSSAALNVQSSAAMNVMSSAAMNIQASAAVNLTAGAVLNVNAGLANFTGAIKCTAIIAPAVVGVLYSPSRGTILP